MRGKGFLNAKQMRKVTLCKHEKHLDKNLKDK